MVYSSGESAGLTKSVTLHTLKRKKVSEEKFASIALYDAAMASIAERSGVEVVLVGDSLGMTVLGFDSTVPVTMAHMIHHVSAVRRGSKYALIVSDLPFMSYANSDLALANAAALMQAGAHVVKLEGGAWLAPTVARLTECGVPVCAHLGLTPQSVNKFGGYRVQGRSEHDAQRILEDASCLEQAGADLLVLECVPAALAKAVTQRVSIPTIGIGAGIDTTAQVLVLNDLLGLTSKPPSFAKDFLRETGSIEAAFKLFVAEVKQGQFPRPEHSFT